MSRGNILVVEDDLGLVEGIKAILELDGYRVATAENGLKALEMLHNGTTLPELIISDIMMPEMDGLQFLKTVRQEARWLQIPIIFLTAKGEKGDVQQGKRLGADDYLVKPFEAEDLLIAVDARLRRQRNLIEAHNSTVNDLKRNILTVLNHEFRTPLTFVVAYADMVANNDPGALSDQELLTFLKGVNTGAVRLRQLIENFILLVELETGDASRTFEWRRSLIEDMPQIMRDARERVMYVEPFKHTCTLHVDEKLPAFIGDREYLTIALTQLLSNAVKFSPPDKPVEMGAYAEEDWVFLWVKDQGRGIPKSEMKSMWEMFYQINRSMHEDRGTGAGLSIVRGIVHMHCGRVRVTSRVGQGSMFTIMLPLKSGD